MCAGSRLYRQMSVLRSPCAGLLSASSGLYLETRGPLPGLPCLPHLPSAPSPLPHLNRHSSCFQPVSSILRGPSLLSNARHPVWGPQCCRVIHKPLRGHTHSCWVGVQGRSPAGRGPSSLPPPALLCLPPFPVASSNRAVPRGNASAEDQGPAFRAAGGLGWRGAKRGGPCPAPSEWLVRWVSCARFSH